MGVWVCVGVGGWVCGCVCVGAEEAGSSRCCEGPGQVETRTGASARSTISAAAGRGRGTGTLTLHSLPRAPAPALCPNPTLASYLSGSESFPYGKLGVGAGSCQPRACFGAESCEGTKAEEAWLEDCGRFTQLVLSCALSYLDL